MQSQLREQRILKSGSPMYAISVPSIAASGLKVYDLQNRNEAELTGADKYLPLDFVEITNDDSVSLYLIINQVDKLYVPANTIKAIEDKNIWSIGLQNLDTVMATTAGKVRLLLQRKAITVDRYLRRFQL